ncbi:MAG: hypothetical protein QOF33_3684, partial [Thermomicrobiales bacterium]|nr:hypothetical protein [Thermomicrobiales bacterium]
TKQRPLVGGEQVLAPGNRVTVYIQVPDLQAALAQAERLVGVVSG